ncbi:MAG: hypothetical protein C5B50_21880 [Verrucomicrobia bacterium]|nr:MAG: hypothetical protein C5B50_21880 [Verrucomicrobiota bacterium]
MKSVRFAILAACTLAGVCGAQPFNDSGWFREGPQKGAQRASDSSGGETPSVPTSGWENAVPTVPLAEAITPQIQALADGLMRDPTQIFNYVHDQIRFVLYFGAKKGAQLTLLEKSGNDFDQSALLVALLRAAGYTNVGYKFGWMPIPYDHVDQYTNYYDLHHWWQLTLNNTSNTWLTATVPYLKNLVLTRGYPTYDYVLDGNTFLIQRLWVVLTNGSAIYNLDPAFKMSEQDTSLTDLGFDLTTALGGSPSSISNTLYTAAGGSITANSVSGIDESKVRGQLTHYTTNLLNYLQSNAPNASVQQVLSSWQIDPEFFFNENDYFYGTYYYFGTYDFGGKMPVLSWANEPTNLMSTLSISFAGTNFQCFMPQLQGQRLSLTFDNAGVAQLWLEDSNLMQSASSVMGNVTIYAHHPDGFWDLAHNTYIDGNYADQTATATYQVTNSTYALLYAFEPDWGWLQQRQNKLDAYLQQGLTNTSRQVVSETLNVMGLGWLLQTAQLEQMLASQLNMSPQWFHRIGRMGQESGRGYYVDIYMALAGLYPNGGDDATHMDASNTQFDLHSYFGSALEHGIIEQLQNSNLVAASTVKVLEVASANGQAIYLANSGNWSSIQSSLSWDPAVLSSIHDQFIVSNYCVLMPQNGSNSMAGAGSWSGFGYEARQTINGDVANLAMIISGGYHGGYVSDPTATVNTPAVDQAATSQPQYYFLPPTQTPAPTGADPVDIADGTFQLETTDLTINGAEPRGISFTRYYNSSRRYADAVGLGPGWTHNYNIRVANTAAPQAGLGGTTPAQAAPMLAATAASIAFYNAISPSAKNWTVSALISKWAVDQMTKAGVSVTLGKESLQFVQQPNGSYTPPANSTATLTFNNSAYSLQMRHGNRFNFHPFGICTNIVDPYSQSVDLNYINGRLWTIQDSLGFTFNLEYTNGLLYKISDGLRNVYYAHSTAYSPQSDLVAVTDVENGTSTFLCDSNHQITATLDGLNRLVVSNVYNDQGHITTQYTQGDPNKKWSIYWSGYVNSTVDPMGGQRDHWLDNQGRFVSFFDELANETDLFYDGQNHVVATFTPLYEVWTNVFDGNHNRIQAIDPLGFSNQFVFDSSNNLTETIDPRGGTSHLRYNAQFSLTASTNAAGAWETRDYNANGTPHTRTDSAGTTTYGYDFYDRPSSIQFPNNLGKIEWANNVHGDPYYYTNARGYFFIMTYNNRRELTNTIAPTNVTFSAAFDAADNKASSTEARGFSSQYFWSATRHPTGTVLPATARGTPATTNFYDPRDWLRKSLDALQKATTFTNDLAGHLIGQIDPLNRTNSLGWDPDGRNIAGTNGAGERIIKQWDADGRNTNFIDQANHTVGHTFDPAGNEIFLTNRNGKLWQFHFSPANEITNVITPLGRTNITAYNDRALVRSRTDSMGRSTTYGYDARKRMTNRTDQAGSTIYHPDGNGNITNIVENGKTNAWTFDAYDHVISYKDADGNVIGYRNDGNGNVTNIIYPGNRNVYYLRDSLGQITNVTDWLGGQTFIEYNLNGQPTRITRPNGTVRLIGYDDAGETTNIVEKTVSGFPIAFFMLNWNSAARVGWEFMAPLPSHTNVPARTMTINDDNQIATFNGQSLTHDLNGNMTFGPLPGGAFTNSTFNARNQLTGTGGLSYGYDPAGFRTSITNGTNVARFVINPNSKLPQVLMRTRPGITNYYIWGLGLLYEIDETATNTTSLTYHFDLRGSTIAITDGNANIRERFEYSSYGMLLYRSDSTDTPFLYNGRYGVMTEANGLLYMQARYYNPYICRFINPDPSGFGGGLNLYAYASGNPISLTDPFGLFGNPVSGPNGSSFPWSVYALGGVLHVPTPPHIDPGDAFLMFMMGGVAFGAVGSMVVASAAPLAVYGLTAVGVTETTATATVTGGLALTAAAGAGLTTYDVGVSAAAGNWNKVAFDVGTLGGGFLLGGLGGGRFIADYVSPTRSTVPPSWNPFTADAGYGFVRNSNLPLGTDIYNWLGTGPTPTSAGFTAALTSSGTSSLLTLSNGQDPLQWLTVLPKLSPPIDGPLK